MNLVTGASGIVGSHVVLELLKQQKQVRVLRRPSSDMSVLETLLDFHGITPTYDEAFGDVTDPVSIHDALEGVTCCFHCAAMVSFNNADAWRMAETNVDGTENIVNACQEKGVRLGYISSTAAIGEAVRGGRRSEQSAWTTDKGKSAYALTKHYAELEVLRGVEEGLEAVLVNPGVVVGPGNWGQSSTTLFLSGIKGMVFYPEGSNGFVDARDVAEIIIKMCEDTKAHQGQHLLIGENAPFKKVFTLLAKANGKTPPTIRVSKRLTRALVALLRAAERLGLRFGNLSAHSLRSSINKQEFDANKAAQKG